MKELKELAKIVLNTKNINEAIHKSADLVKDLIDVERVSIFIYDRENDKVWTLRADYTDKIEMPSTKGIVGYVIKERKEYISNDPYNDEKFNKEIDKQTGFSTKNILAFPIMDSVGRLIGVVEFINKDGGFNEKDLLFANLYAKYISEPLKVHLGIV